MTAPQAPFGMPERYRLEGAIAAGGMAAVYAAHDTLLDRPVAIKVLAEHLNEDVAARQRFQREARAAAALSAHSSVVTIFDVGEHEGRSYIVMERRTGGTLGDELTRHGRIAPKRALAWLRDIADALDAAHERGVVHRDIKPANLLLDEHDKVAVADFGIARLAYEEGVTQTGQVLGTAAYLSPEQAMGEPATSASDRYALAVVAYELLTGDRPFAGAHFAAQARAHIEDPPPPAPGLPAAAQDVLERGLAKAAGNRWASATAFVHALAGGLEGAREETVTRAMSPPPTGEPPPPPERRSRSGVLLVALAGLVLLVAGIAVVTSGGEDPAPEQTEKPRKTAEAKKRATPEPTTTAVPADTGGDPSALNAEGFALNNDGAYEAAVPILQRAVEACGDSDAVDPCAFATYNLGVALNRSGDPGAAIDVLGTRLERWPEDQPDTVRAELADACTNAGQDCGFEDSAAPPGKAKGRGKGKANGHAKDE